MFEKYSNSRDLLYSVVIIVILFLFNFLGFNILVFNTQIVSNSLLQLFGVFFVFILTIITIMFMFDYTKSPILKRLKDVDLFNQIFKRYFDTLIVISISFVYFLIMSIYFKDNDIIFNLWNIILSLTYIINFITLVIISLALIRIYRCLNLLNLVYKSVISKKD